MSTAADDLAELYVHEITAEPLTGTSGHGPLYGPPTGPVACFVDETVRMVRDRTGQTVVSTATITAHPSAPDLPPGSRVTLPSGRVSPVIAQARHLSGGLDLPDHVTWTVE